MTVFSSEIGNGTFAASVVWSDDQPNLIQITQNSNQVLRIHLQRSMIPDLVKALVDAQQKSGVVAAARDQAQAIKSEAEQKADQLIRDAVRKVTSE